MTNKEKNFTGSKMSLATSIENEICPVGDLSNNLPKTEIKNNHRCSNCFIIEVSEYFYNLTLS